MPLHRYGQEEYTINDYASLVRRIQNELKAYSNPERKAKISEYIKTSNLEFIGVELPDIHRIVKAHIKTFNPLADKPLRSNWKSRGYIWMMPSAWMIVYLYF